jgi:hypothetical protein
MSISNTVLSTTPTAIYTSTGSSVVTLLYFCNTSGSSKNVNLWLVPNGVAGAYANNQVYSNYTITASDTLILDKEKIILDNGDSIYANANAVASITTTIGYVAI